MVSSRWLGHGHGRSRCLQFAAEDEDECFDRQFNKHERLGDEIVPPAHGRAGPALEIVEAGDEDDRRLAVRGHVPQPGA